MNKDGFKEAFIDSFSDNDYMVYVVDNEKIIEQLIEKYEVLLNTKKIIN